MGKGTSRGFALPAEALLDALSRLAEMPEGEVPSSDQSPGQFSADISEPPARERLNIAARALMISDLEGWASRVEKP